MTTSLEALPTGAVVTDKSGRHWKLGPLQTRDDQGILYEGTVSTGRQALGWAEPGCLQTRARGMEPLSGNGNRSHLPAADLPLDNFLLDLGLQNSPPMGAGQIE